ncbi:MAG: Smr/MutS family protein [Sumerlaeia bacterium]
MDFSTRDALGLDAVLEQLADHAASTLGSDWVLAREPASDSDAAREQLALTAEVLDLIDRGQKPPLGGLSDVGESLAIAAQAHSSLPPERWMPLARHLQAVEALSQFGANRAESAPLFSKICERLSTEPDLSSAIERTFDHDGRIRDNASPGLSRARSDLRRAESRVFSEINGALGRLRGDSILQDDYSTVRNGRHVVPVKANFRGRVNGIVHGSSSSGETLFIEPANVVEAANDVEIAREREAEEVRKILEALTAQLRPFAPVAKADLPALALIDGTTALARAAAEHGWRIPTLTADGRPLALLSAHHPLLHLSQRDKSVPITVELSPDDYCVILSGPNAGGKTTAMRTLALSAALAQCGSAIPAAMESELPVFRGFYADIGDQQDLGEGVSTFSGHIRRMREILEEADDQSLVLLDELGTGTDPTEGGALAQAILEELMARARLTIATSHLQPIKQWAADTPGARNASFTLDPQTHRPTFRLRLDLPGASEAFFIAENEGLDAVLLKRARSLVGEQQVRMSELIAQVQQMEQDLARERRDAAERAERLRTQLEMAEQRANDLIEERKRVRRMALQERDSAAREVREQFERLIAELPSEEALEQRKKLLSEGRRTIAGEQERVRGELRAIEQGEGDPVEELAEGQKVFVRAFGRWGVVVDVAHDGSKARVDVGGISAFVPAEGLLDAEPKKVLPFEPDPEPQAAAALSKTKKKPKKSKKLKAALENAETLPDPEPVRRPVSTLSQRFPTKATQRKKTGFRREPVPMYLDLHGFRAIEAIEAIDRYLDRALLCDYPYVRIIHGVGEGLLYKTVREFLNGYPSVKSWRPGTPEEGGGGVTVVEF